MRVISSFLIDLVTVTFLPSLSVTVTLYVLLTVPPPPPEPPDEPPELPPEVLTGTVILPTQIQYIIAV